MFCIKNENTAFPLYQTCLFRAQGESLSVGNTWSMRNDRGHSIKWLNKHAPGFSQLKLKNVERVSVNKQLNLIGVFGTKMTLFASTILLFCYSLLPSSSSSSTIVTVCLVLRLHGNVVQCSTEDLADWAHYACLSKIRVCRWSPGEILRNVSV